jgi:hypothetical protein
VRAIHGAPNPRREQIFACRQLFSRAIRIICRWNARNRQNDIYLAGMPFSILPWREFFK